MSVWNENYVMEQLENLMEIDSTTGYYRPIQNYLVEEINRLGFTCEEIAKGGVVASLNSEKDTSFENGLVVMAHGDDIGFMVRSINSNGTLKVVMVGGLHEEGSINANVRIHTRDQKVITGTVRRNHSCVHTIPVTEKTKSLDYTSNIEIVLDEDVHTAKDVTALGIQVGDVIGVDPVYTVTNGYIKSRFIDDKANVAVLLGVMKEIKEKNLVLTKPVKAFFTMYEEIGHGGSWLPEGTNEVLSLDIAPVSPTQTSDEKKVSIFTKDARFPYHYEMIDDLIAAAKKADADYVLDLFTPAYATDSDYGLVAGYDIRHGAIGPGTMGSHSYERTHKDGLKNTYKLLLSYITK